ncbi:MAG: hypothetical protein LBF85_08685 [Tannerella sp.]|nr:hypothetical protein [Tannerella sp.]
MLLCRFAVYAASSQEETPDSKTDRLISFTEGGVLAGNSDNVNDAPFIFHSSLNYAFGRHLSAGLGAGVEFLKETHLPVTANVLWQFGNRGAINPFVRFQTGYVIALESKTMTIPVYYPLTSNYYPPYPPAETDAEGGWMFNPSAGVIFYTKQRVGIALSAGYRHQTLHYAGEDDYRMQVEQNRLSLTLGIIF